MFGKTFLTRFDKTDWVTLRTFGSAVCSSVLLIDACIVGKSGFIFFLFVHFIHHGPSLCKVCHVVKHRLVIFLCIRGVWFVATDNPSNSNTAERLTWKLDWNCDFNGIHLERAGATASNLIAKDELCTFCHRQHSSCDIGIMCLSGCFMKR